MPARHHAPLVAGFARGRRRWLAAALGCVVAGPLRAAVIDRPWPRERAVPPLDLAGLDGSRWSLAAWRGEVLLLNFWASWCTPCVEELPSLERLAAGGAVRVATVNYMDTVPAVRRFLQRVPLTLPVLLDRDGAAARAWTPRVFPTTVLIGRDGQPVRSIVGDLDWTGPEAAALLQPVLDGPSAAAQRASR